MFHGRVGRWQVAGVGVFLPCLPPLPNSGAGDPQASGGGGGGTHADHLHLRHQAQREEQGVPGGHGEPCSPAPLGTSPTYPSSTSRVLRLIGILRGSPLEAMKLLTPQWSSLL